MYKALMEIGGYKKGEIVPDDKAVLWLGMYDVPPVELVKEKKKEVESEKEPTEVPKRKYKKGKR